MFDGIRKANAYFDDLAGRALSLPGWTLGVFIVTVVGLAMRKSDAVMVILTIQTSLDAAATKALQTRLRSSDEAREAQIAAQLERHERILESLQAQNDAAVKRDRLAAKRDKVILTALEAQTTFREFYHDPTQQIGSRAGGKRKANGRADSARSKVHKKNP